MLRTITTIADIGVAMATKYAVMTAHPEGQRRFYRFTDDEYSNCNLYAFGSGKAASAAETFRGGGQFAKKPLRLLMAVGIVNVALLAMRRLSLRGALERLSRRLKLRIEPVILADGAHAVDVDNERTFRAGSGKTSVLTRRVASLLLDRRNNAPSKPGVSRAA